MQRALGRLRALDPGHRRPMDRGRYRGYVAVSHAIAREGLNDPAATALADLAEGLLLARDEAEAAAERGRAVRGQ